VVAVVAVVVLVAGVLGACNRGDGDDDDARPGPERSGPAGVFRAGIVRPSTIDPARARTIDELLVADQLYDSLAAHDPETLEPVPSLAESWTASEDQLHWDFKLRAGAVFSDGSPITSADVKATLDRIARKDSGSSVSDLLELVGGYRAVAVDGTATELSGVVAVAPDVVRIDLESPWSVLPSVLANPAFGVVPAAVAAASSSPFPEPSASVVTSGPYALSSVSAARWTLKPVEGVEAATDSVSLVLFEDKAAAYDALVAGDVDWSEVPPDKAAEAASRFGRSLFRPYTAELFYAFNLRNPKFADVRFREAIVRAVDRAAIIEEVYGTTVTASTGVVVEGLAGHQDDPCGGRCAHDVARAKALLEEMAAEGLAPPEIAIDFESDETQTAVATLLRDQLAAAGITATLRPKPLEEYQQFAVSGSQELFRLGWIAPYPSADAILTPLFLTGFPNNLTGFSSAGVDDLLRAARADPSADGRVARWQEAERAVLAELPIVPIGQFSLQSAGAERVTGLVLTATGTFDARTVSVDGSG
jgi:oligopeptide transport system substrate-binding protein